MGGQVLLSHTGLRNSLKLDFKKSHVRVLFLGCLDIRPGLPTLSIGPSRQDGGGLDLVYLISQWTFFVASGSGAVWAFAKR